jgi:hypothetical protein
MIPEQLLNEVAEARKLLQLKGFKEKEPNDSWAGIGSIMTNGIPDILIYEYVNKNHHIDICIHQNFKAPLTPYASFVHYWGPDNDQHDWGDGLDRIIHKLQNQFQTGSV